MLSRLVLVVVPAVVLGAVDLALKAVLPTTAWDYHQRSHAWSVLALVLLGAVILVGLLPSRFASVAAGIAAGGIAANVLSARLHDGRVPNPLVAGPVAFNLADLDPVSVAQGLNEAGIESRAGCHCATLAHHALGLDPPASCRLSFYLYNTPGEVDRAVEAVAAIAAGRGIPGSGTPGRGSPGSRFRSWAASI